MSNSFLFIIPLTPVSQLSETRALLRRLCFETLSKQNYRHWKALLIGHTTAQDVQHPDFINLQFEGHKEEKLQKATEYIIQQNIEGDYLIRLDDDDVFNPGLLAKLAEKKFDVYVDRYQSHWNCNDGRISQEVRYWFPNTCIHKRVHALSTFGVFPPGDYKKFKESTVLIETEHNDFHLYYKQTDAIEFAKRNNPVYLRTLSADSITSRQDQDFSAYLDRYGYWHSNNLRTFKFLNKRLINNKDPRIQSLSFRLKNLKNNIIALLNYKKTVIHKNL